MYTYIVHDCNVGCTCRDTVLSRDVMFVCLHLYMYTVHMYKEFNTLTL